MEDIRRFNRRCAAAGLLWLAFWLPLSMKVSPVEHHWDFGQFYMGGLMARLGLWQDLYPIVQPDGDINAAWYTESTMRPRYAEWAQKAGMEEKAFRFIQSPVNALMLWPFSYFTYDQAFYLWTFIMALFMWGTAMQAGEVFEIVAGRPRRVSGLIAFAVCSSPLALIVARSGNWSAMVGFCLGAASIGLLRPKDKTPGLMILAGALGKYATLVLLPLAVLIKRWSAVAVFAGGAALALAATLAVAGPQPFIAFQETVVPTFIRTHSARSNQSLRGVMLRSLKRRRLAPAPMLAASAAGGLTLAAVLGLAFLRRKRLLAAPRLWFAAAAGLVSWFLLFTPLFWEHYAAYLCPFWGWAIWEALQGRHRRACVGFFLLLQWTSYLFWGSVRPPLNFFCAIYLLGLALWRLAVGETVT